MRIRHYGGGRGSAVLTTSFLHVIPVWYLQKDQGCFTLVIAHHLGMVGVVGGWGGVLSFGSCTPILGVSLRC